MFGLVPNLFVCDFLKAMEFLSSILGLLPCLYDHTSKHTVYIRDLEKNLQALSTEMAKLSELNQDVKAKVEDAEEGQRRRTNEVGGWMCRVEEMVEEVAEILQSGENEIQRRCLRCCPRNCWSSYTIGKTVSEKLVAVSDLIREGHFDMVASMLPGPRVDKLPLPEMLGSESGYDSICGFLKDPQVGIIGLYGMGGVGKTTILKKVNNEFLAQSNDFDVVIWSEASKSPDVEKIQKDIWNKLRIPLDVWETKSSKALRGAEILRVLKRKRFVLLLDDIWERLDLEDMGIPLPGAQNQSKIVFSTRSQDVCHKMRSQKSVEVACLDSKAAWTLFSKEVGEETLKSHPHIPRLAEEVAEECKGLPLALVTLGRAMAGERDPLSWEKVSRDHKIFPAAISGMGNELFHRLELSYDRLPDNVHKSCFLYCSMIPENSKIMRDFLIELWIGEGFFGMVDDIHEAREHGNRIIKTLKHACLLEAFGSKEKWVKLHDVIRDMALWLYSEYGVKKGKFLVFHRVDMLYKDLETSKLKEAEKIFLWDKNMELDEILVCPNVKTLLVRPKRFSNGFFQSMPLLKVLDLTENANLSEVPQGIGKLDALTYLNLSFTRIKELPIQLKQLKNLMILHMQSIDSPIVNIPPYLISSLISLKLFNIYGTKIPSEFEEILLQELESLDRLSEIGFNIPSALFFNKLKSSHKLLRCMSCANFYELRDAILLKLSSSISKKTRHLTLLSICHCDQLECVKISIEQEGIQSDMTMPNKSGIMEKYFHNLKNVGICHCPKLLDLAWLVYVPFLEILYIGDCESLKELLHDDGRVGEIEEKLDIFSRLRYLKLVKLPRLESIYWHQLLLPSLESMKVYGCKSLRRLPVDSNTSIHNLKKIKGKTCWWNQLEWNEESVKHSFTRYFVNHEPEAYSTDSDESAARSGDGMKEELK